ncbi:MAG TPA: hypothetical protein VGW10_12415 [Solirubrobacteraceae bacterium]|nr:hypothetical protein [Solirubrobacteraceae bacterium]
MRPAATVLVLAALAGCGGDEPRAPEEVARAYVASDDPAKCDDADLAFLERQSKRKGDAARQACRRSVESTSPPKDVRVRSQKVRGDRAEVVLEASGQRLRVTLRRSGDAWRVTGLG